MVPSSCMTSCSARRLSPCFKGFSVVPVDMNLQSSADHPHLDQRYKCSFIQEMVSTQPDIKIKTMMAEIQDKMNFQPTYRKTWMAKQMAIANEFGGWEESYGRLPKYMNAIVKENPESHFVIEYKMIENQSCPAFNRMFWTFKQTIDDFKACRPVIFIDGTFLYGKYSGTLLCAASLDANNHNFPLAFAVVERENGDNWRWFMAMLRRYVTRRDNICVIDNKKSHPIN